VHSIRRMQKNNNEYIFPFSTCETPNENGIAQPYSVAVNVISICIILYFLSKTKWGYSFLLILSLFVFECVHVFSHAIHMPSFLQLNIIHSLAYVINIFYILTLANYTEIWPSGPFLLFLLCLFAFDIYAFMCLTMMYYFSSSFLIFFSVLAYYYRFIPKNKQDSMPVILLLGVMIILLFYNENYNCKPMLEFLPGFPFHALLETVGAFIFYFLCRLFSTM